MPEINVAFFSQKISTLRNFYLMVPVNNKTSVRQLLLGLLVSYARPFSFIRDFPGMVGIKKIKIARPVAVWSDASHNNWGINPVASTSQNTCKSS
jgi:hypothetical protein